MTTWRSPTPPAEPLPGPVGWGLVVLRGVPLALLVYGGLAVFGLLRLVEGPGRPWSPAITRTVCRGALRLLGLRCTVIGQPMADGGALVANHSGWLDIFVLNAQAEVFFVAKSEVAGWPGIGILARATGSVFVVRERNHAAEQKALFARRLAAGHKLLFFPEGTSTDGLRVLPFKSTLFAAFLEDGLRESLHVQPVSVTYLAPPGEPPEFYGWWGDMNFARSFVKILGATRRGRVVVRFHAPLRVADHPDRKALARACRAAVAAGHAAGAGDAEALSPQG